MTAALAITRSYLSHDLRPDAAGILRLHLIQASSATESLGKRLLPPAELNSNAVEHRESCNKILQGVETASLTVMGYHPGLGACEEELKELGKDGAVVALAGSNARKNVTFVATGGRLDRQEKISLASEDEGQGIQHGSELRLYINGGDSKHLRWAVLNCHEYTHVDILGVLLTHRIELLVVVAFNAASRLYLQYALADVHRLYCYIVVANTAELGGSGVYAPYRRIGAEAKAKYGAGGQIFASRGPGEFRVDLDLDIGHLRRLRDDFAERGFAALGKSSATDAPLRSVEEMVPSQHFMATGDNMSAGAPQVRAVDDLTIDWNHDVVRVAVAQLEHMGRNAYVQSGYRLAKDAGCKEFLAKFNRWLNYLEVECKSRSELAGGRHLDLLVLPEVFVPRGYLPNLQAFSDKMGTLVVAGVDYPDDSNANECVVLRPREAATYYRKVTRSQYDGNEPDNTRMSMDRGHRLLRLTGKGGRGAGVLICYDFSHLDLVSTLNLKDRQEPLELVVVVAHNPYGELYKSCCIADAHRFYQYVVMCNVSEYGGSGVFGPVRTPGPRQVIAEAGKGSESILIADIDLKGLREARATVNQELLKGEFQRHPGVLKQRIELA